MAWLDAMRGFAALCVVFSHLSFHDLQSLRGPVYDVFDPGLYGVFVFFLVSGYIVPASLERKGSIRSFWLSRVFRLFPLFVVALAAIFVLHPFGYTTFSSSDQHPVATVLAHMFMLNDLLGVTNLINVLWTLSYEMVFYLLITALFTVGAHKRSGRIALVFACAALALGGLLPSGWFAAQGISLTQLAIIADALIIGGLALAVAGRRIPRTMGALLAAATGLILLAFNERVAAFEGLTIMALMFTGTLLYRAERGSVSRRWAGLAVLAVFLLAMVAGAWHLEQSSPGRDMLPEQRQWIFSLLFAALTFGVGLAVRNRRVPSVLAWLGLVSYSVYLLHPVLLSVYIHTPWTSASHPMGIQILLALAFLAALLVCCALTYYLVEAPMQRLGRHVAQRMDARFGPDRLTARPAAPQQQRVMAG
jgi:peptidoglycan/LPS O-acetylase OafA/YrhL